MVRIPGVPLYFRGRKRERSSSKLEWRNAMKEQVVHIARRKAGAATKNEDEDEGPAGVPGMVTRKAFGSN